jgi:adenylate cyclase
MNTAARLEAANKELGTSICIGPGTAARIDPGLIRSLGMLAVRGRSAPIEVFTTVDATKPA